MSPCFVYRKQRINLIFKTPTIEATTITITLHQSGNEWVTNKKKEFSYSRYFLKIFHIVWVHVNIKYSTLVTCGRNVILYTTCNKIKYLPARCVLLEQRSYRRPEQYIFHSLRHIKVSYQNPMVKLYTTFNVAHVRNLISLL